MSETCCYRYFCPVCPLHVPCFLREFTKGGQSTEEQEQEKGNECNYLSLYFSPSSEGGTAAAIVVVAAAAIFESLN